MLIAICCFVSFLLFSFSTELFYRFLKWAIFWKYDFIPQKGYPLLIELEPNIAPENHYKVYCREIVKEILENGYDRDVVLVGRIGEGSGLSEEYKIIGFDGLREYGDLVKMSEDDKQLRSLRLNKIKTTLRTI